MGDFRSKLGDISLRDLAGLVGRWYPAVLMLGLGLFTVIVSLFVLEVIDDLDDPPTGAWGVSIAPSERIGFSDSGSSGRDEAIRG